MHVHDSCNPLRQPPALRFSGVSKRYGERTVLEQISFETRAAEVVAIAGVNGAGKTTLLRCLLDFTQAQFGRIEIFGADSRVPEARRALSYLPERFVPPPYLTGHEVLQWLAGLDGRTWGRSQSEAAFQQYVIPVEAMRRPAREFSKGMAQKLGLAATLSAHKPLVVLDEPMSGLDPLARRSVIGALEEHRRNGVSLLFTSHSMPDVQRLADRLLIIHDGQLRFDGQPATLLKEQQCDDLESAFLSCIDQAATAPA